MKPGSKNKPWTSKIVIAVDSANVKATNRGEWVIDVTT